MMNKPLNAFTISEMAVVMILAAIVSALAYEGIAQVSSLFHRFEKRQQQVQEMASWYSVFYKKIINAEKISGNERTLMTVEDGKTTVFDLTSTTLIRRGPVGDSIQLMNGKFIINNCDSSALAYCVLLTFQQDEEFVRWEFYKKRPTEEVLNEMMMP